MSGSREESFGEVLLNGNQTCGHLKQIDNICEKCKIFICEDCTNLHLDHIDCLKDLKMVIQEYRAKCVNFQKRARLLIKSVPNEDAARAQLFSAIDSACTQLMNKILDFQQRMKTEMWTQYAGNSDKDLSSKNGLELNLKITEEVLTEMNEAEATDNTVKTIELMSQDLLLNLETQIQRSMENKGNTFSLIQQIKNEVNIKEILTFEKFKSLFEFPKLYKNSNYDLLFSESITNDDYGWLYSINNHGKSVQKNEKDDIITVCTTNEKIKTGKYQIEMKIEKFDGSSPDNDIHIGIADTEAYSYCSLRGGKGLYISGKTGDIIKMNVTINEDKTGVIEFFRNSVSTKSKEININTIDYYFAISLRKIYSKISILSSSHEFNK